MKPHYLKAPVTSIQSIKEFVRLSVKAGPIAADMQPGQFAMLSAPGGPLLPRPFSIAQAEHGVVSFLFQGIGTGTNTLASLHAGDTLTIFGPLGRPFTADPGDRPVIVAGGRGIAPFFELAKRLERSRPVLFYGGRSERQIIETGFFLRCCDSIVVTTEDGSMGRKGLITEALAGYLADHTPPIIYSCGPHAMLHAVAEAAGEIRTELSLEARMACGYGICLGCVIPAGESGYKRVCLDGPVFTAAEVRWKELK